MGLKYRSTVLAALTPIVLSIPGGVAAQKEVTSGVSPSVISIPSGPGSIEGLGESFEPQLNTGSFTYGIVVPVPPGRGGFQPTIRFSYNSGRGNGPLGLGWRLDQTTIQRQTDKGLPRYGEEDTFLFNEGMEIIPVGGKPGEEGVTLYRLKNEGTFQLFEHHREGDYWVVRERNGIRHYLGVHPDHPGETARVADPDGRGTFRWILLESRDLNGNQILYRHDLVDGQVYCREVIWGATESDDPAGHQRVEFHWENRPDTIVDYRPTFRLETVRRLARVSVSSGGIAAGSIHLEYDPGHHLSLLGGVTRWDATGENFLPPAEFEYSSSSFLGNPRLIPVEFAGGSRPSLLPPGLDPDFGQEFAELIDFEGNGLPDFYKARDPQSPDPFASDVVWLNQGDGQFRRQEIPQNEGVGQPIQGRYSFLRDVDGDGLVDAVALLGFGQDTAVYRRNLGGRWSGSEVTITFPEGGTVREAFDPENSRQLDLTFDKQIDTLVTRTGSLGQGVELDVFFNRGDGRIIRRGNTMNGNVPGLPATFEASQGRLIIADLNGDRLQDLVWMADDFEGGIRFWPGKGHGKFDYDPSTMDGYRMANTPDFSGNNAMIQRLNMADLNGDGLADLYMLDGVELRIWLNLDGTRFGEEQRIVLRDAEGQQRSFDPTLATHRLADLTGSGVQEFLIEAFSGHFSDIVPGMYRLPILNPTAPNLMTSFSNGIGRTITVTYRSSVVDYLRDKEAGTPWETRIPFPVSVVGETIVSDGLHEYRSEFIYHDGFYDGIEREFRGFRRAEEHEIGDVNDGIPTLVSYTEFDLGVEQEALKGMPLHQQQRDEEGEIFNEVFLQWDVDVIAQATDGDQRQSVFPRLREERTEILELGRGEPVTLLRRMDYDSHGNTTRIEDWGRVEGDDLLAWNDERITAMRYSAELEQARELWILDRELEREIRDGSGTVFSRTRTLYDDETFDPARPWSLSRGNPTMVLRWIDPAQPQAYIRSNRTRYDAFGNPIRTYNENARLDTSGELLDPGAGFFSDLIYDSTFSIFPTREVIHTGDSSIPTLEYAVEYDTRWGEIVRFVNPNGNTTDYGYDGFGRRIRIVEPGDSHDLPTISFDYQLGMDVGGDRTINWIEQRSREISGEPGTINTRDFFDGLVRMVMRRADGESPGQVVVSETVSHNPRQLPHRRWLPYFEEGTLDWSEPRQDTGFLEYEYDAMGRQTIQRQPIAPGATTAKFSRITYFPLVQLLEDEEQTDTVHTDGDPPSPHAGAAMRYTFDGLRNESGEHRLRITEEIVKLNDDGTPAQNPVAWPTRYTYDPLDNLLTITDSQNNVKFMAYDGLSRRHFMNDPNRSFMWWAHDDAGNVIRTRDARGREIAYLYDGLNRLKEEHYLNEDENIGDNSMVGLVSHGTLPIQNRWVVAESPNDRPADVEYFYDSNAGTLKIPLDPVEQLQAVSFPDVTGWILTGESGKLSLRAKGEVQTVEAENLKGRLAWVRDFSGEEHFSYDDRGRTQWTSKGIRYDAQRPMARFLTQHQYDAADRLIRTIYTDGSELTYEHNPRGFIRHVGNYIRDFSYIPSGLEQGFVFGNGIETRREFDHRLRLEKLKVFPLSDPEIPYLDYHYQYDGASNIRKILDNRPAEVHADGNPLRNTQRMQYDDLYRVTNVEYSFGLPAPSMSFEHYINLRFDRIGNQIHQESDFNHLENGKSVVNHGSMQYGDQGGRLNRQGRLPGDSPGPQALTSTGSDRTYQYDNNGNTVLLDGSVLTWDHKDRMIRFSNDRYQSEYKYDYANRRVLKIVWEEGIQHPDSYYYVDHTFEITKDNIPIRYIWNRTNRLARIIGSGNEEELEFFHHDHLGSTNLMSNSAGEITQENVFFPFGYPRHTWDLASQAPLHADYMFTQKERDRESGLNYFEARYLDSITGRFVSVDPLRSLASTHFDITVENDFQNPATLNTYLYVLANPFKLIDTTGLSEKSAHDKLNPVTVTNTDRVRIATAATVETTSALRHTLRGTLRLVGSSITSPVSTAKAVYRAATDRMEEVADSSMSGKMDSKAAERTLDNESDRQLQLAGFDDFDKAGQSVSRLYFLGKWFVTGEASRSELELVRDSK